MNKFIDYLTNSSSQTEDSSPQDLTLNWLSDGGNEQIIEYDESTFKGRALFNEDADGGVVTYKDGTLTKSADGSVVLYKNGKPSH